jgi:hypothetical protein
MSIVRLERRAFGSATASSPATWPSDRETVSRHFSRSRSGQHSPRTSPQRMPAYAASRNSGGERIAIDQNREGARSSGGVQKPVSALWRAVWICCVSRVPKAEATAEVRPAEGVTGSREHMSPCYAAPRRLRAPLSKRRPNGRPSARLLRECIVDLLSPVARTLESGVLTVAETTRRRQHRESPRERGPQLRPGPCPRWSAPARPAGMGGSGCVGRDRAPALSAPLLRARL